MKILLKLKWVFLAILIVIIGVFFLLRGIFTPALIRDEAHMTRLVAGSEVFPNGFFSISFSRDSGEYTFINIAVDLNKDGSIKPYVAGGETQEEWLVRNMRVQVSAQDANGYPILIPDKTIEERNNFSAHIVLSKNELSNWDGHSASGGLLKEVKISALEKMDYGPYYSPDPEGIRSGGFPLNWLASSYALAESPAPNVPPSAGTGAAAETAPVSFTEFHSDVPDLNQGTNECVPTSAANSLLWLAKKYNFSDKMPSGGSAALISELKNDMNWTDKGVNVPADFISGINAFASQHKISIEAYQVGGKFDTGIVAEIGEELKKGHDVEIDLEYGGYAADGSYKRVGGHMVTIVGVWAAGGSEFLGIHDPLSRGPGTLDIYRIDGTRVVDYAFQGTAFTYIEYAFAESPKSETAIKSVYAGTYEGEFNYEYKYTGKNRSDCVGKESLVGWIPATLHIRVTFEPFGNGVAWDIYTVQTAKIWADDPDFNTGTDGVVPPGPASASVLILPMVPRAENDPVNYAMDVFAADKNSTRYDPLSEHNLLFYFPTDNPDDLWGSYLGTSFGSEGYYISPDGTSMHSYPHIPGDAFQTSDTWTARSKMGTGSGPLSLNSQVGPNGKYCDPKFVSWSLTKVSP